MRISEDLNKALHALFYQDPEIYLLGEDVADPYGGAFKITKGLSTRFPDRVLSTPISEAGFTGVASGLALCGHAVLTEVMFEDFIGLAFDQIANFATKCVSMFGRTVPMRMVIRCPSGGRRGYGPTHSQSLHKHLMGIPNLSIYELSPLHRSFRVIQEMFSTGHPCIFVEEQDPVCTANLLG
jgi:pyruvate/2-oxoglutarate/acetoin dehydrogenase E1 component